MERGRLAQIGAPGRALVAAVLWLGVVFVVGSPASAAMSERGLEPGGQGPFVGNAVAEPGTCGAPISRTGWTGSNRNRLIVTATYCTVLRRAPDDGGLRYWVDQMDAGLTPFEFIEVLIGSAEYRARQVKDFGASLNAIALGSSRADEREERELEAAIEADAERQAEVVRQAQDDRAEVAAERAALVRVRTPITAADFQTTVGSVGLATTDPITDALIHGTLPGDRQPVNVAYVHLSETQGVRVSPGGRRRATVGTWAAEIGAHVAVNGNWYAPYDGPAVSAGAVYGGSDHFYTAMFGFTAEGDSIIEHHRATNDAVDERVVEAVSGHPTLIYRGERTTDFGGDPTFTTRQPRTAIGLDETGDILILVTVDGRSSSARGMTGDETAKLMEQLGAHDAVMLDGGGSSTMWIADRGIVNNPSGALRSVGNQIAVFGE